MKYFHAVVRARWPHAPLTSRENCHAMWWILRARFKRVLASVLMPNHVHLMAPARSGDELRRELAYAAAAFTRTRLRGRGGVWEPAPEAVLVPDEHHLKRQLRYIHLNPCRAGLARDPLEWEWSTHRDLVGASASPWLDIPALSRLWKLTPRAFAPELHRYVSSDPTVSVEGTPLPPDPSRLRLVSSLEHIEWAAIQALHAPSDARVHRSEARRLMIRLAARLGANRRRQLASWIGISDRAVRALLATPVTAADESALQAALLILSAPARFTPGLPGSGSFPPHSPRMKG